MIGRVLFAYIIIPPIAHGIHLFSGVLSVGFDEVSRQHNEFVDSAGYRGLALWIWSVGLVDPRTDNSEVSE